MPSRLRRHVPSRATVAMVTGCLALFFAVGGVGFAKKAVHLVDGHTIKRGTIELDRLSKQAKTGLKGAQGDPGPTGGAGDGRARRRAGAPG